MIERVLDYVIDREWAGAIAAVSAVLLFVEHELQWLAEVLEGLPSDAPFGQILIAALAGYVTRAGVNSNDTVAIIGDGLDPYDV